MRDAKALKLTIDIVQVIQSRGVKLSKKGTSYLGACPFHADSTPSLSVNPRTRLWKCFGCDAGGDVFSFVQKLDDISFPEAVRKLCPDDAAPAATASESPAEHAVDRPPQPVLDRVIARWQKDLAQSAKAQAFLKLRKLWHPELLRALRIGYSSGGLSRALPGGGKLRRQLTDMGILNDRGNEFFYGRIVIPILADDALVNVYGRAIRSESEVSHLYLPGPRRGVFHPRGIMDGHAVILTESLFDALSLLILGFINTTASYGARGFTPDLRAALIRAKTPRVYCAYDADPAGDPAGEQLAHDLAGHGIEVFRVVLPCKDPNDFLRGGGTRDQFSALLDAARPLLAPRPASTLKLAAAPASEPAPAIAPIAAPAAEPVATAVLTLPLGDRTYQLESRPEVGPGSLRVALRVLRQGRTFVDSINLYSDRARSSFIGRLMTVFRGEVPRKTLEEDFFALLDEAEALSRKPSEATTPGDVMTEAERAEALAFLRAPDLTQRTLDDLVRLGVVGEDDNKLLAFLVATSRKLPHPLSLSVISGSSAGKSFILNRVVDLMPPEDVLRFTRMSPRALFYDEPGRYKHKILHIEEAIGAKDADLGVRSMQSERRLANLVTMTDPKTGKLKTQESVVEGPLTYMTSSVDPLDYETGTRSFEIAIDESNEQTGRIVARELAAQTLGAIRERLASDAIVRRHRNAQRLIEPVMVTNPYAPQLTFPSHTLRLRREVHKYIGLMNTLALLFQHQRPIKTFTEGGTTFRYIEVARSDVAIANRLIALHLTRVLSDLPGAAQKLLVTIQAYVTQEAEARGTDPMAISFSRRQVREQLDWSDYQLNGSLDKLVKLELIEVAAGSFGKRYVYTLSPDHRLLVQAGLSIDERIAALGLTPAAKLKAPADTDLSGSQSDLARLG